MTTIMIDHVDTSFETFVANHRTAAIRYAMRLTRDRQEAEDVVQDALSRLWQRYGTGAVDNPWGYLVTAIRNGTIDRYRRRRREMVRDTRLLASTRGRSEDASMEDREELLRALSGLPLAQRRTIVLRYLLDMTESETARALGISAGTAKSNASRGISKLRVAVHPSPTA